MLDEWPLRPAVSLLSSAFKIVHSLLNKLILLLSILTFSIITFAPYNTSKIVMCFLSIYNMVYVGQLKSLILWRRRSGTLPTTKCPDHLSPNSLVRKLYTLGPTAHQWQKSALVQPIWKEKQLGFQVSFSSPKSYKHRTQIVSEEKGTCNGQANSFF